MGGVDDDKGFWTEFYVETPPPNLAIIKYQCFIPDRLLLFVFGFLALVIRGAVGADRLVQVERNQF